MCVMVSNEKISRRAVSEKSGGPGGGTKARAVRRRGEDVECVKYEVLSPSLRAHVPT